MNVFLSLLVVWMLVAQSAWAQSAAIPPPPEERRVPVESAGEHSVGIPFEQKIMHLERSNKVYEQVIKNMIKRIEDLERAIDLKTSQQGQGGEGLSADTPPSAEIRERVEQQIRENSELINTAFEQRLNKEGGMLLRARQFIYEPGLSFAHSSYEKIAVDGFTVYPVLVVGDIVSEKVNRDIITNNHSFRFGVGVDTQVDLVIPLGYEKEVFFREDGTSEKRRIDGLGDISLGISHQLVKSNDFWPDTVVAFNWKTKSGEDPYRLLSSGELALGSGFETFGLSLTSMANTDPIIMFGGITVNYTDSEHKPVGVVKPGQSHGLNLGMALALNFDTSLSFSFQYLYTEKTKIDSVLLPGSNMTTGTFSVGLSTAKGGSYAVDIDLSIGLTSDSPDFQLTVSFPFDFYF